MSSKVYKSEKPKLKFAQSNINHVYRGNTAETQYKPTVRQYGMQVVGKLQGTRRLPPPAWVPSIKAESGGLDSRIALVPPGGSGWGAPTTTESAPTQVGSSTTAEVGGLAVTATLPSVNGTLMREALGTSFEPAYARSHFGPPATTTVDSTVEPPAAPKTFNAWTASTDEGKVVTEQQKTETSGPASTGTEDGSTVPPPVWAPRSQASGGLAANKPFFQRPTPVTSSSATTATTTKSTDRQSASGTSGGASEIVGESTGWAAISEEEPNFDEQIIFSDEENPDEIRTPTKAAPSEDQVRVGSSASPATPTFVSPPKSIPTTTSHASQMVLPKKEPVGAQHPSMFAPVTSNLYNDSASRVSSDVWSAPDATSGLSAPLNRPLMHPPNSVAYSGNVNSDERMLLGGHQYMQHPTAPTVHPLPSVFPDQFLSNRQTTMIDSFMPAVDADSDLHAQRQARTQEFKSAVERAQQARAARQTVDAYNTEGDALIQRSVVNLISDSAETHASTAFSASTTSSNILLPPNLHGMQPLLGNVLSSQFLSAYQQGTTPNRSDIAAAMAAATAVAMACNGTGVPPPMRSGIATSPSTVLKSAPLHQAPHSTVTSSVAAAWHGPFSSASTTVPSSGMFPVRPPTLPQVIQSTMAMASGGAQGITSGSQQNAMYLDPEFVDRVLEILNHQQVNLPTADQLISSNRANTPLDAGISSSTTDNLSGDKTTSQHDFGYRKMASKPSDTVTGEIDDLGPKMDSSSKGDLNAAGRPSSQQTNAQFALSGEGNPPDQTTNQSEGKRIPGLMDVKVSSSRSFNLGWDEEDHLPSGMGGRGRAKPFATERSRGAGRGRRSVGRFPNEENKTSRNRSSGPSEGYEGRSYGANYSTYQDHTHVSRQRTWQPSKTRPSEHPSNGTNDDYNPTGTQNDAEPGSNSVTDTELNQTTRFNANFSKEVPVCGDVDESEGTSELVETRDTHRKGTAARRPEHVDVTESAHFTYGSGPKPRRGSLDLTESNATYADRQDYPRRAERGRRGRVASSSYYPSSRTFSNEDAMAYSGQYAESKPYSRTSRGITFTRGHRALASSTTSDSRGRRTLEEPRNRVPDRDFRGAYSYGTGYSSARNARGSVYYDSEGHEQFNSPDNYPRSNTVSQDTRRHQSYKSRPTTGSSHVAPNEFRHDEHFSDGEQGGASRKSARIPRNRSHEGSRPAGKTSTQRFTGDRDRQRPTAEENTTAERTEMTPPLDLATVDQYGDSDIPTVRVPASDMGFNSRSHYAPSRAGRSGTFPRGSGPRRNPNRVTSVQQTKRAPGSGVPSSRRYRDQRDRYHDDKDGDGGAAAGGTGRSATGGESAGANGPGNSSRTNGCENTSGNQSSGGTREASACDNTLPGGSSLEHTENKTYESQSKSVHMSSTDSTNHNHADRSGEAHTVQGRRLESGTTGCADTHSSHTRGYQATGRSERTYVSVSGGRSNTGQRFHRSNTSRYYQSDYSNRRSNFPSIPPLMSLKPHGPFTRNSQPIESQVNLNPESHPSEDPPLDSAKANVEGTELQGGSSKAQTSSDPNEYDSDQDSLLSDGFTKVVSKASKRMARRRLQQELSASSKPSTRRNVDSAKQSGPPTDNKREHSSNHSTSLARHTAAGQNKLPPRKTKPLLVKPTFMGPPLSSINTSSTNESSIAKSKVPSTSEHISIQPTAKTWFANTPTQSTTVVSDHIQSMPSTTRPWSKVVGTKSSPVSSATERGESGTVQNASAVCPAASTDWSADVKHPEPKSVVSESGASVNTPPSQSKAAQVATLESKETATGGTYSSARQFWSPTKNEKDENLDVNASVKAHPSITSTVAPNSSSDVAADTPVSSTVSVSVSTVSNNICKVRPQQQQPMAQNSSVNSTILPANVSLPTVAPISPNNNVVEQPQAGPNCASEVSADPERTECDYEGNANQPRSVRRLPTESALLVAPHPSNRLVSSSWTDSAQSQLHASYYPSRPGALPLAGGMDSSFSTNLWPSTDHVLDNYGNRLAAVGGSAVNQPYSQVHGSDILSNLFTGPNTSSLCADPTNKSQVALIPRSHSYSVQPYGPAVVSSSELHNGGGLYGTEANKLSSHSIAQSQAAAFATVAGSVYVSPQLQQQTTGHQTQPAHSFPANWTVPSNPQRYRQRYTHQVEPSAFGGFTYQADLQNEYAYLPSATGCVQPPPTGGLFSAVQGQPQSNYHPHNSARHNMGPPTASNPWSLLGNPTGASAQEYGSALATATGGNATGGGLLPHPVPQGGYNATHGSVPLPLSTSPNSNFVTHHNYVGVIGGGRPNTADLSNVSNRQRGVAQNIFPSHNISHSPSAQNQPQFPVHSAFYPSLSPSHHQRLQQLQQFTGSQARPNVHNLMNPATGLYATAFGTAPQPNQATPPPMPSQLGYTNFTSESTAPMSFYSTSQSQSTLGLQHHLHSQRPGQSSAPHMPSRNLGAMANHGGSPLLFPSAVAPTALSGYGQPTPSAALSGYPIKHVLPTL